MSIGARVKYWKERLAPRWLRRISEEDLMQRMSADWDRRARKNARYYVATGKRDWTDEEFFGSGEITVRDVILNDLTNICQGRNAAEMRVLEIGCGAARVTRALAKMFGEVYAVDVSGEMIHLARKSLYSFTNVHLYHSNGKDLSIIPDGVIFDFAFCNLVFQHVPSRQIIEATVTDVGRHLLPGALFKFQVQGDTYVRPRPGDTWRGAPFSTKDAHLMAERCGFECTYEWGAGTQYYWLWFFKK